MGTSPRESGTGVSQKKQIFNSVAKMTAKPPPDIFAEWALEK